jgi:FtsH-binding integral membrane protein
MEEAKIRRLSPDVRQALLLALAGFASLVLFAVLLAVFRGGSDESTPTVLEVALVALGVIAFATMILAGVKAASSLRAGPMMTRSGRLAVGAALAVAALLVAMAATFGFLAATDTWEGDSEPFLATWLILALAASLAGAFAREPGRRGLLILPFLLGTAALVLFLSEITGLT